MTDLVVQHQVVQPQQGDGMASASEKLSRRRGLPSPERLRELEKQHNLSAEEAAEVLGWSRRTLYNRNNEAKRNNDPTYAPPSTTNHSGDLEFHYPALMQWKKSHSQVRRRY